MERGIIMGNKKMVKYFSIFILIVTIVTLLLSIFFSSAFLSSFMLMLSLFLFANCYYLYEDKSKKNLIYILFSLGVLLIAGALAYTFVRIL